MISIYLLLDWLFSHFLAVCCISTFYNCYFVIVFFPAGNVAAYSPPCKFTAFFVRLQGFGAVVMWVWQFGQVEARLAFGAIRHFLTNVEPVSPASADVVCTA